MKTLIRRITIAVPIILAVFFMTSCDPENFEFDDFENGGWWGIENEDTESIEDAIQFGSGNLPSSADISNRFPPVGNQGQYGTCVTWAVGYNHKSYMEAVANDRTTSDLNNEAYQFSPKYLFWAIPSGSKGADCGGTGFEPAYDVMLNQGIAQMSVTPYTDLGDCSGSTSQWDGEAAQYSIESYREIGTDASSLKQYIANGQVVSFGAKLGDNFMSWNSSDVHYSDTYDYSGPHAYHAMTISGYDDSKGINGAFRVRNSWGTGWGDNGDIWVDENFFTGGDFAFCAFIATNSATTDPDPDGDNEVNDQEEGKDLLGWELNDIDNPDSTDLTCRVAKYNVFNSGNETIYASEDWNIIYIYYNAYDANDYGILLYDYYSDDYGSLGEDGELTDGGDGLQNWWNNINVPAGHSVAQELYGEDDARFRWPYTMPSNVTGEYYLVIIADGYDVLDEVDEENNYFYLTDINGEPIQITNGVIQDELANNSKKATKPQQRYAPSDSPTMRTKKNRNAYTPHEIMGLIADRKASGELRRKAEEFKGSQTFSKRKAK